MAHVPTEAEIDAMSEDELQAYLASESGESDDPAVEAFEQGGESAWLTATGASSRYAWLLIIGSLIGIAAS